MYYIQFVGDQCPKNVFGMILYLNATKNIKNIKLFELSYIFYRET